MELITLFNIMANLLESEEDLYSHFSTESISEFKDMYKKSSKEEKMTVYYRYHHILSAVFQDEIVEPPLLRGFSEKHANIGDIIFIHDNEHNPDLTGLFFECFLSLEKEVLIMDTDGEIRPILHADYFSYIPVDEHFKNLDVIQRREMRKRDIEIWELKGLSRFEISDYEKVLQNHPNPNEELTRLFTDKHSFYYMEGLKRPKTKIDEMFEALSDKIDN